MPIYGIISINNNNKSKDALNICGQPFDVKKPNFFPLIGELHYNPAMYPNSPYQGESWTPHDTSFGYSQDGEMGDDPSMASFDPSTININEILGIASSMYTGNQTGSMDIN